MTQKAGLSKTSMKVRLLCLVVPLVMACSVNLEKVSHNPDKAAYDVNEFLLALYLDENYDKALQLAAAEHLRQYATVNDLKQTGEKLKQERGSMKSLKGDSYLMTPGRSMELFLVGEHEKGLSYHRLVLMGDTTTGYKVTGAWFKLEPYPANQMRKPFESEMTIFNKSTLHRP